MRGKVGPALDRTVAFKALGRVALDRLEERAELRIFVGRTLTLMDGKRPRSRPYGLPDGEPDTIETGDVGQPSDAGGTGRAFSTRQ